MKKRIVSLVLTLCLLVPAAAVLAVPAGAADSDIVADIYLCHRWSAFPSLGHDWVYIENLTNETLQVGAYQLPPHQGVSLGNFGLTRADGNGTYYNVEAYCGNHYSLSGMVATKDAMTRSDLARLSNVVLSTNHWDPIVNCDSFAAAVWNAGSGKKVIPLLFPVLMKVQILLYGNVGAVKMYSPTRDQVLKQHGTGAGATLTVCKDGTVAKQIG
ncbi:MAG: hypothetical protein IKN72_03290 [Clostridia bacterium]|nr:hypothetical protein [Clostridia bacterium]